MGRKREALAHYERCAQMLRRHGDGVPAGLEKARAAIGRLGAEPEGRPVREPSGNASVTPEVPGRAASPARLPLAGREMEMERFARLMESAAHGPDGKLRLLRGEPGIGKTRLLEAMGAALSAKGWIRLRGRAFEAERGRAFGPWIDAARTLAAERPGAAGDCPLLRPSSLPEHGLDPSALFEAVREWLSALARSAPVALVLDDIHWLDASSVALLQYLMRGPGNPLRLMLAGLRSVAAPQDAAVEPLLRLLRREGWEETWDVGPLSAEDTADLLRLMGSKRDPGEVFARSAGHPLAALALALEGGGDGRNARVSLEAMLDERIRLAGDDGRQVLQWASLLGRGLPPALLESLLDLPVHALLSSLERLEAQGLVRVEEGEAGLEYLFAHDLIRRRAQESLSAPRRARMHAHVAQTLKRHPSLSRGWEETAQHAELGEQWELAAEACMEAGHHCVRLRAYDAVEDLVQRGLDHLDRLGGHWSMQQEFCFMINHVMLCLNRTSEGLAGRLERLIAKARERGQQDTVMAGLYALAGVRFVKEQSSEVLAAALEMEENLGEVVDPANRAFAMSGMALCLLATDLDIPRAEDLIGKAMKLCEEHGFAEADTVAARGWLTHRQGRIEESRGLLLQALPLMKEKNLAQFQHQILCYLARIGLEEGLYAECRERIRQLRELEPVVRTIADRHFPDGFEALVGLAQGEAGAAEKCDVTLELLRACNCKVMTAFILLFRSELDLRAGRLAEIPARCRETIERCEPLGRISEPSWARCLLGLAALRAGGRKEAKSHWDSLAPALKSSNPLPARVYKLAEELAAGLAIVL
jgi:tetratricopeptide (TPR) repeat protein